MPRRILEGVVVSNKMDKTVVVNVVRYVQHPLYRKFIKRSKKYMAHDETNTIQEGDTVKIIEIRPMSKNKTWQVVTNQ